MLDYLCPEKRRQALRGRNLPRDIWAEVRQGVPGPGALLILRGQLFASPLDTELCLRKSRGLGRSPNSNVLLFLLLPPADTASSTTTLATLLGKEPSRIEWLVAHAHGVQPHRQFSHHRN